MINRQDRIRTTLNTVRHVQEQCVAQMSESMDLEEQLIAIIHILKGILGNKQIYSRQELWKVVGEPESMYGVNHLVMHEQVYVNGA